VILALAIAAGLSGTAKEACAPLIPSDLAAALSKAYPQYRLPRGDDQDQYNVRAQLERGGTGCLGVAEGDFDGDGRRDVALLLARKDGRRTRFVVALRGDPGWRLELIETSIEAIENQYVDVVAPGAYESGFYGEYGAPAANERKKIRSSTEGVETGTLESTASYYFRVNGQWVWLWISD